MKNKCTKLLHFAVALLLCAMAVNVVRAQSGNDFTPVFDAASIADTIVVGHLSEEQFYEMDLTPDQRLDVFKEIKRQRGWTVSDENLRAALTESEHERNAKRPGKQMEQLASTMPRPELASPTPNTVGYCNIKIPLEEGYSYAQYPIGFTRPNAGECMPPGGHDWFVQDIIAGYNTPNYPRTNTANIRVWSPYWWVRDGLRAARILSSPLAANGLCTPITRVCLGAAAQGFIGADLKYVYLWQK